jgi:hypothetical protein
MKIDLALLTRGNQNLTDEDNGLILKEVYKFIRRSKRVWEQYLFHLHCLVWYDCIGSFLLSCIVTWSTKNYRTIQKYQSWFYQ